MIADSRLIITETAEMEVEENNNNVNKEADLMSTMNCSACSKSNEKTVAQKFCVDCQEYFCKRCIDMHGNFSVLSKHVMIDMRQLVSEGRKKDFIQRVVQVPTERCSQHPAKVIDMYCEIHDIVGCSACFQPHYKSCEKIHYIPDIVNDTVVLESLQKTKEEMQSAKEKIEKLMEACYSASVDLKKMKDTCLEIIKEFRGELNEILDELEVETVKAIEQRYNELDTKLNADVQVINDRLDNMRRRLDELEIKDSNKSTLFVCQNMCQQIVDSTNDLLKSIGKPSLKARIFFKGDYSLKSRLLRLPLLGVIRDQKTAFGTVSGVTEHDIAVDDDKEQCNIWGTCITGDGHILIADNANNKIKMLDKKTYKVVATCPLLASPRSLCTVSDTEVATTLSNKGIRFVTTSSDHLVRGTFLQLDHNCFGLTVAHGSMYISDGSQSVYMYNTEGTLLSTITLDEAGENIFSESRDITVSDDLSKIHVADSRKGLITLNRDGNVLWKYSGSELKGAYGVCTDGEGCILVTGILSHNVLQISPSGEKMAEIIKASEGIQNPISVCFDKNTSKVIVTKNGKYVYAFEFV